MLPAAVMLSPLLPAPAPSPRRSTSGAAVQPGCVWPSIVSWPVMVGKTEAGVMMQPAPGQLGNANAAKSVPGQALASMIAARSVHWPAVLVSHRPSPGLASTPSPLLLISQSTTRPLKLVPNSDVLLAVSVAVPVSTLPARSALNGIVTVPLKLPLASAVNAPR